MGEHSCGRLLWENIVVGGYCGRTSLWEAVVGQMWENSAGEHCGKHSTFLENIDGEQCGRTLPKITDSN